MRSPTVRLSAILARQSDVAVVFRRGPSKQVLLIRWHRRDDSFYSGQWFKGRIYEDQCDLSPSGERLIYFAADYKPPHHSWTAISRPPFLTALALWPKGDCWAGGGLFKTESEVVLDHPPTQMELAFGFKMPKDMSFERFGPNHGGGAGSTLYEAIPKRNGWSRLDPGKACKPIWSKINPASKALSLHTTFAGIDRRPCPLLDGMLLAENRTVLTLGEIDWADWDSNGDLLFARAGCLFRCRVHDTTLGEPACLLDTRSMRFRNLAPSEEATTWKMPLRLGDYSLGI